MQVSCQDISGNGLATSMLNNKLIDLSRKVLLKFKQRVALAVEISNILYSKSELHAYFLSFT